MRFSSKAALVTGAASGIGRATALRLASEGARVVAADRNAEGLRETLTLAAGDMRAETYDATDLDSCRGLVANAAADGLDILCNIAGISGRDPRQNIQSGLIGGGRIGDQSLEQWN